MSLYDPFEVGDKVWSLTYGFCTIEEVQKDGTARIGEPANIWIKRDGSPLFPKNRPRCYFHAVADTDLTMLRAIAKGDGSGCHRPKPRSRFDFIPGDRVLFCNRDMCEVGTISNEQKSSYNYPLRVILKNEGIYITANGKEYSSAKMPNVIRLLSTDEEKQCDTVPKAMRFIAQAAIDENWKP